MGKISKRDAEELCRQFGHSLNEFEDLKAFADFDDEAGMIVEELPPPVIEEDLDVPKDELDDMIAKLQTVADDTEAKDDDVTTAKELVARLEELRTAKTNAQDFLDKLTPVEEAVVEGEAAPVVPPPVM